MCGRFTITYEIDKLFDFFGIRPAKVLTYRPRYNISPSNYIPVVVTGDVRLMKWGLVPKWAKEPSIGYKMINARAESVSEKPSYKGLLRHKRCIIPADGFYEWHSVEGEKIKQPLRFTLKDNGLFGFAGLWDCWHAPDGSELETCTIITTSANELLKKYHERMPVILPKENYGTWLNAKEHGAEPALKLLTQYPADQMACYKVSRVVNSPKNDLPECIKEVIA